MPFESREKQLTKPCIVRGRQQKLPPVMVQISCKHLLLATLLYPHVLNAKLKAKEISKVLPKLVGSGSIGQYLLKSDHHPLKSD